MPWYYPSPPLKSEVLAEIEKRPGLGFDQFIRAVLLAQNEFTAFLHADGNARAELLELLTRTDTFTVLSIQASERSKAEQQALDDLTRRAADQQPLDPGARAAIDRGASEARTAVDTLAVERDRLDGQLRWHVDHDAALDLEGQARTDLDEAARAVDDIVPRRAHLARVQNAQPARSLLGDLDRTAHDLSDSRERALPLAEQTTNDTRVQLEGEGARLAAARDAPTTAEEQQRLAAPDIERARELELRIETLTTGHVLATTDLETATASDLSAQQASAEAKRQHDAYDAKRMEASLWLGDHTDRRELAAQWPRWDTLLTQARQAHEEATTHGAGLASALERIAVLREAGEAAAEALRLALQRSDAQCDGLLAELDDVVSLPDWRGAALTPIPSVLPSMPWTGCRPRDGRSALSRTSRNSPGVSVRGSSLSGSRWAGRG